MHPEATVPVDPYHAIATFYDLEHDAFHADIELLLSFADATGGPILEMACGSGRVLAPLAAAGHTVVGIDRSTTMLDRARSRLAGAHLDDWVSLAEADLADATALAHDPFAMVAFTLNALMHLPSPELQLQALRIARRRLAPGGLLFLDLANPVPDYLVHLAAAPILEWSTPIDGERFVDKWVFRNVHAVDQVIDTTIWYDVTSPGGQLLRHRSRFELRYLHPNEVVLMLDTAGFGEIRLYGSYELDPLDDASERLIVTAASPAAGEPPGPGVR